MDSMMRFMASIWRMPWYWRIWIALLILVNGLAPLLYLNSAESKVVLTAFIAAAVTQMIIFEFKGFVRLLGIGHIYWLLLIGWLLTRLNDGLILEEMMAWIVSIIVLNMVSLIIDLVDVIRYWRGERAPTVVVQRRDNAN